MVNLLMALEAALRQGGQETPAMEAGRNCPRCCCAWCLGSFSSEWPTSSGRSLPYQLELIGGPRSRQAPSALDNLRQFCCWQRQPTCSCRKCWRGCRATSRPKRSWRARTSRARRLRCWCRRLRPLRGRRPPCGIPCGPAWPLAHHFSSSHGSFAKEGPARGRHEWEAKPRRPPSASSLRVTRQSLRLLLKFSPHCWPRRPCPGYSLRGPLPRCTFRSSSRPRPGTG
mmetsp:Transcript_1871/g.4372  ORF Transcript_1871/g.4372 Transcript_1871/m.4372 type:complete len:227 (+) Transcript_1871:1213-1893(+)